MGLLDLFRPKWQHSDPAVRLAAIDVSLGRGPLWQLASSDPSPEVRASAVACTEVNTTLAWVALHDDDANVRLAAVRRIAEVCPAPPLYAMTDHLMQPMPRPFRAACKDLGAGEEAWWDIARKILAREQDPAARAAAARLLRGREKELLALALSDPALEVGLAVLDLLDDDEACRRLALEGPKGTALEAVKRLDDDDLAKVACGAPDDDVRRAASERLDDDDGRLAVARSDAPLDLRVSVTRQIEDTAALSRLARRSDAPEVRLVAFEGFLDHACEDDVPDLAKQLLGDADGGVRALAARHTLVPGRLEKLARQDPDERVRAAAVEGMLDGTMLADIAAKDQSPLVREAAQRRAACPWRERAHGLFHWDTPRQWAAARGFAAEVAAALPGFKVVLDRDEEEVQLRGRLDERPVKIVAWISGNLIVRLRWLNPLPDIALQRDPGKKPRKARDDDWGEEDEVRLFVGPAVFVEDRRDNAEAAAAAWAEVPEDAAQAVIEAMGRWDLDALGLYHEEAVATFEEGYGTHDDPVAAVVETSRMLAALYRALGAAPLPDAIPGPALGACGYCGARFNARRRSTCPNCGAPGSW